MTRIAIPRTLRDRTFYDSQYACVICQSSGCHIHHIDGDPSNNDETNLVVLCSRHHDEAHTKRELSRNLDKRALISAKESWLNQVAEKRINVGTLEGQKAVAHRVFSIGMSWGYINLRRVVEAISPQTLTGSNLSLFRYCVERGLIDNNGILIKPDNVVQSSSYVGNTIYDWYEDGDDHRLHTLFSELVDRVMHSGEVIHIDENNWTKTQIRSLISPGSFIFVNRAFYFKAVDSTIVNEHRKCRTFKRNIEIEFFIDTKYMFGTTSISVSFTGHRSCAALLLVKSIDSNTQGKLVLTCTPISLGIGFKKIDEFARENT